MKITLYPDDVRVAFQEWLSKRFSQEHVITSVKIKSDGIHAELDLHIKEEQGE